MASNIDNTPTTVGNIPPQDKSEKPTEKQAEKPSAKIRPRDAAPLRATPRKQRRRPGREKTERGDRVERPETACRPAAEGCRGGAAASDRQPSRPRANPPTAFSAVRRAVRFAARPSPAAELPPAGIPGVAPPQTAGRAGRQERHPHPGPGRAEGHEHPEAQPGRQGSGHRRRRRPAQAGADLQDPAGAGREERPDLLRRRAGVPAGRLRLPARARVQLSARARTTSTSRPRRSAASTCAPATPSPARSARPRKASAISR